MTKILDRFEKVIKLICAILFIGIMILMAAQVLAATCSDTRYPGLSTHRAHCLSG